MCHFIDSNMISVFMNVYCILVSLPCGILGQVRYLIVSFPDLCHLSSNCIVRIGSFVDFHMISDTEIF